MSELKPCPFCGGEAEEYYEDGYQQIECSVCGARSCKDSEPGPNEHWNRRVPDPAVQELAAALEQASKALHYVLMPWGYGPITDKVDAVLHKYRSEKG